jgi:uncharacterized lipoprotein YajG
MTSRSLTASSLGVILAASVVLLAACGQDDEHARAQPKAPELAPAQLIAANPYAIACGHVRDQQQWASVTRRATVAIADREKIPKLNRLQATQSLFYAMTELCKSRPASYEPVEAAVRAVRQGTYRADLSAP